MKTLICLLLLFALTMTAADLTGKWHGKFDVAKPNGETEPNEAYLNLKLDGAKVTGTAGPNEGEQWAIQNGKLEAGKLTFEVLMEENGEKHGKLVFDLLFDGDTIRGTATGTGDGGEKMSAKVDLKRAG